MFHLFPYERFYSFFQKEPFYILFETLIPDEFSSKTWLFYRPDHIVTFRKKDSLDDFFSKLTDLQNQGHTLAVMVDYEFAYGLEENVFSEQMQSSVPEDQPLFSAVACLKPLVFDHRSGRFSFSPKSLMDETVSSREDSFWISDCRFSLEQESYRLRLESIKNDLKEGRFYQINFTDRFEGRFEGSPFGFYSALKKQQSVSYAAFIRDGNNCVLSLSPELFLRSNKKGKVVMKPMKGTASRSSDEKRDREWKTFLRTDPKNISENVMIVDLLRNDLGRVCSQGTVNVDRLCVVEPYKTVWQMISRVSGLKRKELSLWDIFRSVFPAGSVTGAPKIESMKAIYSLEKKPRSLYTGALGWASPCLSSAFSVPIRTISISEGLLQMGVGSGIVFDSDIDEEYRECLMKGEFLIKTAPRFRILETLCWKKGAYQLLDIHMQRISETADRFAFSCNISHIKNVLAELAKDFFYEKTYKVRLKLNSDALIKCRAFLVKESGSDPLKIDISPLKLDSKNPFLYHKTTCRELYRQELNRVRRQKNCFDLLFFNEDDFLCEGSISNVYLKKNEEFLTPPVSCGLLNGVYRRHLLKTDPRIKEKKLKLQDILEADAIYLSNSIIGFKEAVLIGEDV